MMVDQVGAVEEVEAGTMEGITAGAASIKSTVAEVATIGGATDTGSPVEHNHSRAE